MTKKLHLFILALICIVYCKAATNTTIDGITYEITTTYAKIISCDAAKTEVNIPEHIEYEGNNYEVRRIENQAFKKCNLITKITIPKTITYIGAYPFRDCVNMKEFIFEDGDAELQVSTAVKWFNESCTIEHIYLGRNLNPSNYSPFQNITTLTKVEIGDMVTELPNNCFWGCTNLTNIIWGKNLKIIRKYAFYQTGLKTVKLPDTIEEIGGRAFSRCENLEFVYIPSGRIGSYSYGSNSFSDNPKLETVVIGDNATSMYLCSFDYNDLLHTVKIGSNVKTIDSSSFNNSPNVECVYSYAKTPPTYKMDIELRSPMFSKNVYEDATLYVYEECIELYKKASEWKKFNKILPIPEVIIDENDKMMPEMSGGDVNIQVKRTIKANEWSTLTLPFSMTTEQLTEAFGNDVQLRDFVSYNVEYDSDDNIIGIYVIFDAVNINKGLKANHPYLIKTSNDINDFRVFTTILTDKEASIVEYDNGQSGKLRHVIGSFISVYEAETVIPENCLFLKDNKFWYSSGLTKSKALRAYFRFVDVLSNIANSNDIKINFIADDEMVTSVEKIKSASDDDNKFIYTLSGQCVRTDGKMNELPSGVYIINRKKILVK